MPRTTPPRPVDVLAVFPELAGTERTATRLHPRPGSPTVHDSHIGGPLLWPAGEPWPTCTDEHDGYLGLCTLADVRLHRRILAEANARPRQPDGALLTPGERATLDRIDAARDTTPVPAAPVPMLPLAQLYARDVPAFAFPDGADLLQVLWCPLEYQWTESDGVRLRWRNSADVTDATDVLAEAPVAAALDDNVPAPCVLHPEPITEYPPSFLLDPEAVEAVDRYQPDGRPAYQYDLSVAPGWRLGGWPAPFTFIDAYDLECSDCGGTVDALLTVDGTEWDGGSGSWRPVEDAGHDGYDESAQAPTRITIGRGYTLQIYLCTADPGHRPLPVMQ